jgi:hypothetical protein
MGRAGTEVDPGLPRTLTRKFLVLWACPSSVRTRRSGPAWRFGLSSQREVAW